MVSDIMGSDYDLLIDNIVLECNKLPISGKNEKFKKCDFVIRDENVNIINLELNKDNYNGLQIKNMSYVFQLFYRSFKKGKGYNSKLNISQININCFKMNNKEALSSYHIRRDSDYEVYNDNFVIYDLNIVIVASYIIILVKKRFLIMLGGECLLIVLILMKSLK